MHLVLIFLHLSDGCTSAPSYAARNRLHNLILVSRAVNTFLVIDIERVYTHGKSTMGKPYSRIRLQFTRTRVSGVTNGNRFRRGIFIHANISQQLAALSPKIQLVSKRTRGTSV